MASERPPPFLVNIQNVDISTLDFQQGFGSTIGSTKSKSRHVTFVEATTLFLFVGSTSGTVFLFSRESLDFLLMIPFKGGKVCNISASNDESHIAVASIRGFISLYRMPPNIHLLIQPHKTSNSKTSSSSSAAETFRHLYDIPHHVNNEITEMKWSPNGKFLFVGDNQGVISQIDIGSLDEFPRPPPSRVILKLLSRILQIDCSFPCLAVSTLNATFLCDLEKEDFTRIQSSQARGPVMDKRDIKSAGLCIASQGEEDNKMILLIGEVGTGTIFRCGMDGSVISRVKVDPAGTTCNYHHPVQCFDPKNSDCLLVTMTRTKTNGDLNFSPGKMFPTDDDQFIVSVSSNRIFVYDVKTCKIILWNEDFNRINSLKIIANYGFLWYANKLLVFALTPFRPYGKQLYKAGLHSVLENWISYAVASIGYQVNCGGDEEKENDNVTDAAVVDNSASIKIFRKLMMPINEEDEFCAFVSRCIPFDLIDPEVKRKLLEEESYDKRLTRCVRQLSKSVEGSLSLDGESCSGDASFSDKIQKIFKALEEFYSIICNSSSSVLPPPSLSSSASDLTLLKVLSFTHVFLRQQQLLNLKQDLRKHALQNMVIDKVAGPILSKFVLQQGFLELQKSPNGLLQLENSSNSYFLPYTKCPMVQKYFEEIGISLGKLIYDALIADVIILLLPLVDDTVLYNSLMNQDSPFKLSSMFFTWLTILTFFGDRTHSIVPYSGLLRTIQNPQYFNTSVEEIVSSAYREVIFPRRGNDITIKNNDATLDKTLTCFTHFITFTILYSKSERISKSYTLPSLILTLFPYKRGVKIDLIQKIIQLSTMNPVLGKMFYEACSRDGKSFEICACGIQAGYGSLEEVPPFQRAIEEAVLHQLVQQYFDNPDKGSFERGESSGESVNGTLVHQFAMKRCLILPYLASSVADDILPDDSTKITMILRSGICEGLQHVRFNLENLKVLQQAVKQISQPQNCLSCGRELSGVVRKVMSMDCVGVWIMENVGSIGKSMKILKTMDGLNNKGEFSLRFYQLLIKKVELQGKRKGESARFSDLSCSMLHSTL